MAWTAAGLRATYSKEIAEAELRPSWTGAYERAAEYILKNKDKYIPIERATTVPWQLVAALHWREASGSFAGVLHNGEKIIGTGRKTRLVPAGRGPFKTWTEAAIDAIKIKRSVYPPAWDMEGCAWFAETFNGMGYRNKGRVSPYLWSGTTLYTRGKYVSDGVYSSTAVDQQLGVMPLYQILLERSGKTTSVPTVSREERPATMEKSRKVVLMDRVRVTIQAVMGTIGGWFTADSMGIVQQVAPVLSGIASVNTLCAVIACGAAFWIILNVLDKWTQQDIEEGRHTPSGSEEAKDVGPV